MGTKDVPDIPAVPGSENADADKNATQLLSGPDPKEYSAKSTTGTSADVYLSVMGATSRRFDSSDQSLLGPATASEKQACIAAQATARTDGTEAKPDSKPLDTVSGGTKEKHKKQKKKHNVDKSASKGRKKDKSKPTESQVPSTAEPSRDSIKIRKTQLSEAVPSSASASKEHVTSEEISHLETVGEVPSKEPTKGKRKKASQVTPLSTAPSKENLRTALSEQTEHEERHYAVVVPEEEREQQVKLQERAYYATDSEPLKTAASSMLGSWEPSPASSVLQGRKEDLLRRRHHRRVKIGTDVMLLVAAVAVLVVCLLVLKILEEPQPERLAINDGKSWCNISQSCIDAQEYLHHIINSSIDPCEDFYGHVCSKWTKPKRFLDSYLDQLVHAMRVNVFDHLDGMRDSPANRNPSQAMSVFFKSCFIFLTESQQLDSVVDEAIGSLMINTTAWKSAKSLTDIFPELVRLSLVYGAHSVIKITATVISNVVVFVDIGQSVASTYERLFDGMLKEYLKRVISFVSQNNTDIDESLIHFDARLEEQYTKSKNAILERLSISDLRTNIETNVWVSALRTALRREDIDKESKIFVRSPKTMRSMLKEVSSFSASNRNMYLLLSVLSDVLNHDFNARYRLNGTGEQTECLRLASVYFSSAFHQYIVDNFQPSAAENEIFRMETNIRKALSDRIKATSYVAQSKRSEVVDTIDKVPLWVGNINHAPRRPTYNFLGPSFVRNVVLLLKAQAELRRSGVKDTTLPLSQWQFAGNVGYVRRDNVVVASTPVLRPSAFYADEGKWLNYATVGSLLAEGFVQAGLENLATFPPEEEDSPVLECYRSTISAVLGNDNTSDTHLNEFIAMKLALEVVYEIKAFDADESHESTQLFFRRFCLVGCGMSSSRDHLLPGSIRCNLLLPAQPEFSRAFGCGVHSKSVRRLIDCH
ncbi:endothelin-converting enzyme-like 1 [Ornithodoros turicata]|uniref:endothelin-converting enzyme-like 1 n=1 Tax=Ornithodoros turicata TaxID=34597 RepID=UPI003138ECE3